jgi:hypothetical protein
MKVRTWICQGLHTSKGNKWVRILTSVDADIEVAHRKLVHMFRGSEDMLAFVHLKKGPIKEV